MPDYGHDLIFGSFVTPSARSPQDVVGAVVAAERAGLDLVTMQDHPYQPAFLDTWTLLSYAAARTERIRLAPNVANLPLRPPAVLARAAASLDLLSGGRVDLGLGTGAFWDAIAAMGGPRRTPGEAVDALSEAIDVIRGLWDTSTREILRVDGTHYRLDGAKRGPAPAHPIGIWLGAYKPRMLRLTGEKADGWLPTLGRMDDAAIRAANAAIDDAALAVGRDPRAIRRLANVMGTFGDSPGAYLRGPAENWVEVLAGLALEHGFSGFLLAGDDVAAYPRIAAEVIPAVREAVAAERAR